MTEQYPAARSDAPVLRVEDLHMHFVLRNATGTKSRVRAVDGVSFQILPKETLAIVGESGCGKSTVGRTALRLIEPTSGRIFLNGADITAATPRQMRPLRRAMQMVFQDPYSSLDPRMTAGDAIGEPLIIHGDARGAELKKRVVDLMERVGLKPEQADRYPHEFSGGQRQRIGIARALALSPRLIVADEPVSALDVSIQAQVLNLLLDLQQELGLSYLFISHDLAVVRHLSDRVAVMYLGRIIETAPTADLFADPMHPYTEMLLAAAPKAEVTARGDLQSIQGEVPDPSVEIQGCSFRSRCPYAQDRCALETPKLREVALGRFAACHFPLNDNAF